MTGSLELPRFPEIHATIRETLEPVVRPLGYIPKRGQSAGWSLKANTGKIFVQFQLHPKATDSYQGGRMSIEFEHTLGEGPGRAFSGRARFDQLLTAAELETVVEHQDQVIASLPRPPARHVESYPESLRETYLKGFQPQARFAPGDLWLRYRTLDDVRGWLGLISGMLPSVLSRAGRLDPHEIYLGSAIDLSADPLRPKSPTVIRQKPGG